MNLKTTLYRLTFPNEKVYIGVTDNPKRRWSIGYKDTPVGEAINEYGWDNVKKEILVSLEPTIKNNDTILKLEQEFIKLYGEKCYNRVGSHDFYKEIADLRRERDNYKKPRLYWEIDGVSKPARDWCEEYGLSLSVVEKRMWYNKLTLKQALTFPKVPIGKTRDPIAYWREMGCFEEQEVS